MWHSSNQHALEELKPKREKELGPSGGRGKRGQLASVTHSGSTPMKEAGVAAEDGAGGKGGRVGTPGSALTVQASPLELDELGQARTVTVQHEFQDSLLVCTPCSRSQ